MHNFRRGVSILLVFVLFFVGAGFLYRGVEITTGRVKTAPFLEEVRQYDVLLFGTSHVVNGFLPMQLWEETGIRSYNLGIHGGSLAASYWAMRLATQKTRPQVAVLDVLNAEEQENTMELGLSHTALDPYPLSTTKLQAVLDLYADWNDRMELLLPLDIYHNRWKNLTLQSLLEPPQLTIQKGAEPLLSCKQVAQPVFEAGLASEKTRAMGYLERFIRYCQDNDIIPVVTYIPYCYQGSEERQTYCNAALDLARSLGAMTLDIQQMQIMDPYSDWADGGGHLNASGARKATQVLGQWLRENVELPDGAQDPQWAADYEIYREKWLYRVGSYTDPTEILNISSLLGSHVLAELTQDAMMEAQLMGCGAELAPLPPNSDLALRLTVTDQTGTVLVRRSYRQTKSLTLVE